MKLSDFLPWNQKKGGDASAAVRDRRQVQRRVTDGAGWIYWADEAGEGCRTRATFVDISEDSSGMGFVALRAPLIESVCWALPDGGKALACGVRHIDKSEAGFRVGATLDFEDRFMQGGGGARVQWIDSEGALVSAPATMRNSGQGLIEVSLPVNVPARCMVFLEGPQYGCLAICRGSQPDGSRFLLVAEAVSDSFVTAAAAA